MWDTLHAQTALSKYKSGPLIHGFVTHRFNSLWVPIPQWRARCELLDTARGVLQSCLGGFLRPAEVSCGHCRPQKCSWRCWKGTPSLYENWKCLSTTSGGYFWGLQRPRAASAGLRKPPGCNRRTIPVGSRSHTGPDLQICFSIHGENGSAVEYKVLL